MKARKGFEQGDDMNGHLSDFTVDKQIAGEQNWKQGDNYETFQVIEARDEHGLDWRGGNGFREE